MSQLETAEPGAGGTAQPTGTEAPPARDGGDAAASTDRALAAVDTDVGDDDDGDDVFVAARYANAAAALKTTGYGAVAPIPRPDAVLALLRARGR